MIKLAFTLIFFLTFLFITACASSSAVSIVDGFWLLTEMRGEAPIPGTFITAEFNKEGMVSGSSGCNRYSTTYTVNGNQLSFGEQTAGTLMACLEPVMDQEREFLDVLADTANYEIRADELLFFDADGNELASFVLVSQDLADTSWTVIGYNNGKGGVVSVIIDSEITANFSEGGRIFGNSGCNDYSADYETDGDKITIRVAEVTEMDCLEPDGVMEQEQLYLAALRMAETYKIEGVRLKMRALEGSLVADFQLSP